MTTQPDLPWSVTPVSRTIDTGEGWFPLIQELHKALAAVNPDYRVVQVKEKFGGLRYYIEGGNTEMQDLIGAAESKSFTICEICGDPGVTLKAEYWLRTLCEKHHQERNERLQAMRTKTS